MRSYLCNVNKDMKSYYVNKYGNENTLVNVIYEDFYEEYAKNYV